MSQETHKIEDITGRRFGNLRIEWVKFVSNHLGVS